VSKFKKRYEKNYSPVYLGSLYVLTRSESYLSGENDVALFVSLLRSNHRNSAVLEGIQATSSYPYRSRHLRPMMSLFYRGPRPKLDNRALSQANEYIT
jgi:hypothetical protein